MSLFVESTVKARGRAVAQRGLTKVAAAVLTESMETFSPAKQYDVFLSHSVRDADLVLGIKSLLEDSGNSVYVDWIEDKKLDRSKVTAATAETLRIRMNSCKSLFYITTPNAVHSKWMPWECGYFDGKKDKVAIVPVVEYQGGNAYAGQEYLGLYPYVVQQGDAYPKPKLWIHLNESRRLSYDEWVSASGRNLPWRG